MTKIDDHSAAIRALRARAAEGSESADLIVQAIEIIGQNLSNPPTLQVLADMLFISRTRLCSSFKRETGFSVGEFLNFARIERAQILLANSQLPIGDIAAAVGYVRQSSFAERFKEETGITPTEWRRANKRS